MRWAANVLGALRLQAQAARCRADETGTLRADARAEAQRLLQAVETRVLGADSALREAERGLTLGLAHAAITQEEEARAAKFVRGELEQLSLALQRNDPGKWNGFLQVVLEALSPPEPLEPLALENEPWSPSRTGRSTSWAALAHRHARLPSI